MIEEMIVDVKRYLPLNILGSKWDGTIFQIYGLEWSFTTLSAWRISTNDKMIVGCFDNDSEEVIKYLINLKIINITFQTDTLKIDPVFILSNGQKIEIFSTDTYEPWTFHVSGLEFFTATPSDPSTFDSKLKKDPTENL